MGSGLAIAIYRNRANEPIDIEVLRHKFYFDEFYAWLINWTQELLARVSAFFDRWIIDTRRSRWQQPGNLGNRGAAAPDPGRESASLRVSVRARCCRRHLFRRFPLMVLFVIFCPIVAAILIMAGAAGA